MWIQNFTMTAPQSYSWRSKSLISRYARCQSSGSQKPSMRSTITRPYHERSKIATCPDFGSLRQKRHR